MAFLGLILAAAAAVLTADVVIENAHRQVANGRVLHQTLSSLSVGGIFIAGAVAALVFALGLAMLFGGMGRARRRRLDRKAVVREKTDRAEALRIENERLESRLAEERAARERAQTAVAGTGAAAGAGAAAGSGGAGGRTATTADRGAGAGDTRGDTVVATAPGADTNTGRHEAYPDSSADAATADEQGQSRGLFRR